MNIYMMEALKEANKAYKEGDVPVGCVIVYNNKIIAKAHNKKEKTNDAVAHAEILAIKKACKKMKTWRLERCEIYITMEPCLMCSGAIIQSRINKVYYGIKNPSFGGSKYIKLYNKKIEFEENVMKDECQYLIKKFFEEKRV